MRQNVFMPADVLLPRSEPEKWSVVACDQYSSEPEYWQRVESLVGSTPSSLNIILPEAWLKTPKGETHGANVPLTMRKYLDGGIFSAVENSFIYTERRLSGGGTRCGLIGRLDLEAYDYVPYSCTPVHSTEGTVADRLPPRARLRAEAAIESPHIVLFIDDPECTVIEPIAQERDGYERLYDFGLMEGGGHLSGWRVDADGAERIDRALCLLADGERFCKKYGLVSGSMEGRTPLVYAVGDGNHSLAAAKLLWESLRGTLTEEECSTHPARYALVELENLHDSAVGFEPIHRVIFGTASEEFLKAAKSFWNRQSRGGEIKHLRCVSPCGECQIDVGGLTSGEVIGLADEFISDWTAKHGGRVDYIHGDDTALAMARRADCAGFILPRIEKSELFSSLISYGAFPRKSFSVGHACDKRFYFECRKLR